MSVHILHDKEYDQCCFYCSTTMWAFGPIMYSYEEAENFLTWLKIDLRKLTDKEMQRKYYDFMKEKSVTV